MDGDKCTWVRENMSLSRFSISKSLRLWRKLRFQENREEKLRIVEIGRFSNYYNSEKSWKLKAWWLILSWKIFPKRNSCPIICHKTSKFGKILKTWCNSLPGRMVWPPDKNIGAPSIGLCSVEPQSILVSKSRSFLWKPLNPLPWKVLIPKRNPP